MLLFNARLIEKYAKNPKPLPTEHEAILTASAENPAKGIYDSETKNDGQFIQRFVEANIRRLILPIALILLFGCTEAPTLTDVAQDVNKRSGYTMPNKTELGKITLPPGASLEDNMTEDEAISIALWNNAAFGELLINLDIARGDLVQAGLLPNPIGLYSFSAPDKPLKYALEFPIEALWLRPFRINAAKAEAERVSQQLSQAGLNLIRDTRRAYVDVLQAYHQSAIINESLALRRQISELTQKRLSSGDISINDANIADLDALAAEQSATRIIYDVQTSEERLRNIMGIGAYSGKLTLDTSAIPQCTEIDVQALLEDAIKTRPDALAAKEAIIAAKERNAVSRLSLLGISGIADATSGRDTGHEMSPAVRSAIPVLNQNQGIIERASAEEERALRNEQTVIHQIRLDVNQSYMQYRQACSEWGILKAKVKIGVEKNFNSAKKAFDGGNISYLMVLEASRALIDNRLREAQLIGDVRRASAELERSVGKKVTQLLLAKAKDSNNVTDKPNKDKVNP